MRNLNKTQIIIKKQKKEKKIENKRKSQIFSHIHTCTRIHVHIPETQSRFYNQLDTHARK